MSLVSKVGKTLVNAGTKALKIAAKNPKTTAVATGAGIGGYAIGKVLSGSKSEEEKKESSTFATIAKVGLLAATGIFLGKAVIKILKNPQVKKVMQKPVAEGTSAKFTKVTEETANFVRQKTPEGVVKEKLDAVMKNFKNHMRKLNEEKCYFKGSSEEFSKRMQASYTDFKKNFPEYTDYIKKHLDDFMSKC